MASVSLRTLRYYDRVGLLSPAHRTESGHRLYAEEDLLTLQRILALKFLGFSLEEIRLLTRTGPQELREALAQQKEMMKGKRRRIDSAIRALEEAENMLNNGQGDEISLIQAIRAIQMAQEKEWVKRYFSEEQLRKMEEMSKASYSEAARRKLDERSATWTEEDQKRAGEQWAYVATEADRLAAAGATPDSAEAQALAKVKYDLLSQFTQGDPEIASGLNRFWESFNAMPKEERPFESSPFESGPEGTDLLNRALELYKKERGGEGR
jgi:DNA-binding transcriptional MerR regulator